MIINGLNYRKNKNYIWRQGNPKIDKDIHNNPVSNNYIAFVKVKDCDIVKIDKLNYLEPKNAPAVKLGYGLTYQGYTEFKKKTSKLGKKVFDSVTKQYIVATEYLECTSFYLHRGEVYTSVIRKAIN